MTLKQKETIEKLKEQIVILKKRLGCKKTSKRISNQEISNLKKAFRNIEKKSQVENAKLVGDVFKRLKKEEKEFEELANTCDNYLVENEELKQTLQHKINFYEHCLDSRNMQIDTLKDKLRRLKVTAKPSQ